MPRRRRRNIFLRREIDEYRFPHPSLAYLSFVSIVVATRGRRARNLRQFPPEVDGNVPLPTGRQIGTLPREERPASHSQSIRTHALEGAKYAVDWMGSICRVSHQQKLCCITVCMNTYSAVSTNRVKRRDATYQENFKVNARAGMCVKIELSLPYFSFYIQRL